MRKIIIYIAASLNGKIADSEGKVDWLEALPLPEEGDYGYAEFYQSIDTTIQGYNTYEQVNAWDIDFPYPDKTNYVLTRKQGLLNTEHVKFISTEHLSFIESLKNQEGQDIWLVGGGQINTMLLNADLIDEIIVFTMPIILSGGKNIFASLPKETKLQLIESKSYSTGAVEMRYKIS